MRQRSGHSTSWHSTSRTSSPLVRSTCQETLPPPSPLGWVLQGLIPDPASSGSRCCHLGRNPSLMIGRDFQVSLVMLTNPACSDGQPASDQAAVIHRWGDCACLAFPHQEARKIAVLPEAWTLGSCEGAGTAGCWYMLQAPVEQEPTHSTWCACKLEITPWGGEAMPLSQQCHVLLTSHGSSTNCHIPPHKQGSGRPFPPQTTVIRCTWKHSPVHTWTLGHCEVPHKSGTCIVDTSVVLPYLMVRCRRADGQGGAGVRAGSLPCRACAPPGQHGDHAGLPPRGGR